MHGENVTPIKQEVHQFASRHRNGVPMYPGAHVLTWAQLFPGIWVLIDISGAAA